jgi:hypothetical protein
VQEVAAATRSLSAIESDKDVRKRFPGIPPTEMLLDWFLASSSGLGITPGYLYVTTSYVCWEPLTASVLFGKIVVPIAKIVALNKCHIVRIVPVQGMLFEVIVEGDAGKANKQSFRAAKWADIFRTIQRQAQLLGRSIKFRVDGRDAPDLLAQPAPAAK